MAFVSYALFAGVLAELRTLVGELDRRVQERTAALQREVVERQRLDQEIAQVADRERRRLGRDLHDSLGQHLTGSAPGRDRHSLPRYFGREITRYQLLCRLQLYPRGHKVQCSLHWHRCRASTGRNLAFPFGNCRRKCTILYCERENIQSSRRV